MTGVTLVTTLYLQTVTGLSPLRAGLWSVPQYVAMALGAVAAPVLARRVRTAYVIAMGLVIAGTGLILLAQVDDSGRLGPLVTGLVLASGGISLPMAVVTARRVPGAAGVELLHTPERPSPLPWTSSLSSGPLCFSAWPSPRRSCSATRIGPSTTPERRLNRPRISRTRDGHGHPGPVNAGPKPIDTAEQQQGEA